MSTHVTPELALRRGPTRAEAEAAKAAGDKRSDQEIAAEQARAHRSFAEMSRCLRATPDTCSITGRALLLKDCPHPVTRECHDVTFTGSRRA